MQNTLPQNSPKANASTLAVIERYGSAGQFLTLFNPDHQAEYTTDLRRVFLGNAPSLGVLANTYDVDTAETWLQLQLYNLSEFSGCRDKISIAQVTELAQMILNRYGYLKVTELMLFFQKFKHCDYGHFWGSVDPMVITNALRDFIDDRNWQLQQFENEKRKAEQAEEDARDKAMRELYEDMVADAWAPEASVNFPEFYWGTLYLLNAEQLARIIPKVQALEDKTSNRYGKIREMVDAVLGGE